MEGTESLVSDIAWPAVAVGAPPPPLQTPRGRHHCLHPRDHTESGQGPVGSSLLTEGTHLSLFLGHRVKRILMVCV